MDCWLEFKWVEGAATPGSVLSDQLPCWIFAVRFPGRA